MRGKLFERCAIVLCGVGLVAAPGAGARDWTPPEAVGEGIEPSVAVDASGAALIAYGENGRVHVRERSAAGQLGPEVIYGSAVTGYVRQVEVEMAPAGNAVVAWSFSTPNGEPQLMAATPDPGFMWAGTQVV